MYGVQLFSTKTNKDLKTPKKINNYFGEAIWDSNISFGLLSFWGGVSQKLNKKEYTTNIGHKPGKFLYESVENLLYKSDKSNWTKNVSNSEGKVGEMHSLCEKFFNHLEKFSVKDFYLETPNLCLNKSKKLPENCGNLLGCSHVDSFFSSKDFFLGESKKNTPNFEIIHEHILDIDIKKKEVITNKTKKVYDYIFICLGPYQTQKLLNKALKTNYPIFVKEPALFTIPIFYRGRISDSKNFLGLLILFLIS